MYQLVEDMPEKYAHPLPRVYAIFTFAIEYAAKAQPPQHTTTGSRAGWGDTAEEVRPWLSTQWQTEK